MIGRLGQKLASLQRIVAELQFVSDPQPNPAVFERLLCAFKKRSNSREVDLLPETLTAGAIGEAQSISEWQGRGRDEYVLAMKSVVFADFEIRLFLPTGATRLAIYLPGSLTSVEQVFDVSDSHFHLRNLAELNGVALCSWNWPMQGNRLHGGIYRNVAGHDQLAKEYARVLPVFGSSLFVEYLAEMEACLRAVISFVGEGREIVVAGWSQGAWFSYFAPLLNPRVNKITSAGSCAAYSDILAQGCGHVHGYFMYPFLTRTGFELDDICRKSSNRAPIHIVCGDADRGCLASTLRRLEGIPRVRVSVLSGHSHSFTGSMRYMVAKDMFS